MVEWWQLLVILVTMSVMKWVGRYFLIRNIKSFLPGKIKMPDITGFVKKGVVQDAETVE